MKDETMNIYALKGHKVIFTGQNGGDYAREHAHRYLEIGKEYTVDHTDVGQSSTSVYLEGIYHESINGIKNLASFNSVMFDDVSLQSEEDDKKHKDYKMWNHLTP